MASPARQHRLRLFHRCRPHGCGGPRAIRRFHELARESAYRGPRERHLRSDPRGGARWPLPDSAGDRARSSPARIHHDLRALPRAGGGARAGPEGAGACWPRTGRFLDRIEARYAVAPHYVVALWGIESDFGRQTGGFSVIGALATLAHDGRRSAFFPQGASVCARHPGPGPYRAGGDDRFVGRPRWARTNSCRRAS